MKNNRGGHALGSTKGQKWQLREGSDLSVWANRVAEAQFVKSEK
jgi:hypothetical protein